MHGAQLWRSPGPGSVGSGGDRPPRPDTGTQAGSETQPPLLLQARAVRRLRHRHCCPRTPRESPPYALPDGKPGWAGPLAGVAWKHLAGSRCRLPRCGGDAQPGWRCLPAHQVVPWTSGWPLLPSCSQQLQLGRTGCTGGGGLQNLDALRDRQDGSPLRTPAAPRSVKRSHQQGQRQRSAASCALSVAQAGPGLRPDATAGGVGHGSPSETLHDPEDRGTQVKSPTDPTGGDGGPAWTARASDRGLLKATQHLGCSGCPGYLQAPDHSGRKTPGLLRMGRRRPLRGGRREGEQLRRGQSFQGLGLFTQLLSAGAPGPSSGNRARPGSRGHLPRCCRAGADVGPQPCSESQATGTLTWLQSRPSGDRPVSSLLAGSLGPSCCRQALAQDAPAPYVRQLLTGLPC